MGSNDIPPARILAIYPYLLTVSNSLLQSGGTLWTLCYLFSTIQAVRDRTYGMPLFALALNLSWELVYAIFVAETTLEKGVFTVWLLLDLPMVYVLLKYGYKEWTHSKFMTKYVGHVFVGMTIWCVFAQWGFAKWWIDNSVNPREGKFYRGVIGPDTTELGFWSALVAQTYLSVASLAQLCIRQHTGGVSWSIWATRTFGSILGFYLQYFWLWYTWPEGHPYFLNPFALLLLVTGAAADMVYPVLFYSVREGEKRGRSGVKKEL